MKYISQPNCNIEYDEFIVRGFSTQNPSLSSMQEVILIFLQELSYYLLKLKDFGADNEVIQETIIEALSGMITNIDYSDVHFKDVIINLAEYLSQTKALYSKLCEDAKIEPSFIKPYFRHPKNYSVKDFIQKGEKHYIERNVNSTFDKKNMFDIIIMLAKRLCLKIIQIKSYKKDYKKAYFTILKLINTLNLSNITTEETKQIIKDSNMEYYDLLRCLYQAQEEEHGKRESVYIPFSPRNGKAILVSGIDLKILEKVLESTKDRGVDVYTHGMTMLMAHTLSNFRKYPHLVGHFGKGSENCLFDFAAFPGAILMTRFMFQKVEYLYRGKLFTTDDFAPRGVTKIEGDDFEPLIVAALQSKGFTKKQQEIIQRVGFRQKEMEIKIRELIGKMERNEIRHLYFIGILNQETEHKDYFNKFLKLMPKDCFAVALSHDKNEENVLHVDSFYDYLFVYEVFEKMNKIKPIRELNITIFITKCDQYTVTNIINFINLGIKSIYLSDCLPSLINPAMCETLKNIFSVKSFTNPKQDLEDSLSERIKE